MNIKSFSPKFNNSSASKLKNLSTQNHLPLLLGRAGVGLQRVEERLLQRLLSIAAKSIQHYCKVLSTSLPRLCSEVVDKLMSKQIDKFRF
ncbi:hypothetical protein HMPREF3034_00878 [Prevotella sp. DNF00663]|nr:hypothetical protein HMPREF3034_00878 [Prevotella sp. DNF00663]